MIICKKFKAESAHIVRNCSSEKCKYSIHGHSSIIEVFLTSDKLDNAQMIVDFGLLKTEIGDFIDSFDHSYIMWSKESDQFKKFIKESSDRYIELPVSPSAESLSLLMLYCIDKIIQNTIFNNGEGNISVSSVRYHETATGYAESYREDLKWITYELADIEFSADIKAQWKRFDMWSALIYGIKFENPKTEQQINL